MAILLSVAFATERQFADDRLTRKEATRNITVRFERNPHPHSDLVCSFVDRSWCHRQSDVRDADRVDDPHRFAFDFGPCRTGDDTPTTTFVDRIIRGVANHGDAHKFERRKEEQEQQRRDERELDRGGARSLLGLMDSFHRRCPVV